jgi:UDP-glucose 4-epimerase
MSWHPRDEARLFDVNVRGTFHLVRHAARHGVGRFVFASSGEVYPEVSPVRLPIDEGHPTQPTSAYGLTKLLGEEIVRSQHRRGGMPFCILRFAHTQAPEELLDPGSFFSGPRFYVNAKLRQLRGFPSSPAVDRSIAALETVATDVEQHYVGCSPDGTPYRMGICDVRDMVAGLRLALEHPAAVGETFNIGPAGSFDFDEAVAHLARATGLGVVPVRLHTVAYRYDTSVEKAASRLGHAPRHTIFGMIDDAVRERDAAHPAGPR